MLEIRLGFTVKYSQFDKKTVIEGFINRSHQPIEFKQKTWFCGIRVWLSKFIIKLTSFLPFRISSGNIYVRFSGNFDIPFEYNAENKGLMTLVVTNLLEIINVGDECWRNFILMWNIVNWFQTLPLEPPSSNCHY